MSRREKGEADHWWKVMLQEMRIAQEDEGLFTQIILKPGLNKSHVTIQAEIWERDPELGSRRTSVYSREWPHGDHNFLSGACWQAVMQVWILHDRLERDRVMRVNLPAAQK